MIMAPGCGNAKPRSAPAPRSRQQQKTAAQKRPARWQRHRRDNRRQAALQRDFRP